MSEDVFEDIKAGMIEALEYAKGNTGESVTHVIEAIDVRAVRNKLGLSQKAFSDVFGVSLGTLRNWEQGRRLPRGPARILMHIIDKEPETVSRIIDELSLAV